MKQIEIASARRRPVREMPSVVAGHEFDLFLDPTLVANPPPHRRLLAQRASVVKSVCSALRA
jgi:hypothetical protein